MKRIYFVRHGESEGNAGAVFQPLDSSLTQKGREQAVIIAKRCADLPIEFMVSSTMNRAKQTAEIIGKYINKDIDYSDFFIERCRPTEQIGLKRESPEALQIEQTIIDNFSNPSFRYSDEENFSDLNERAEKALNLLVNRKESDILVVAHGLFLRVLMGRAIFRSDFTAKICDSLFHSLVTNNSGLTLLEYDEEKKEWFMRVWNDHAHLG